MIHVIYMWTNVCINMIFRFCVGLCTFFKLLNSQSKQHSVLEKLGPSVSFVLQTFCLPWFLLLLSLFVSGFACRCLVLSCTCAHVPSSSHKFVSLWCTLIRKINAFDMADIPVGMSEFAFLPRKLTPLLYCQLPSLLALWSEGNICLFAVISGFVGCLPKSLSHIYIYLFDFCRLEISSVA